MPFPPPTHGHEEAPIADSQEDYLAPKKSAIHAMKANDDLQIKGVAKGDALTTELSRNPQNSCQN